MLLAGEGGEIALSREPLGVSHNGRLEALQLRISETSLNIRMLRLLNAMHMYRQGAVLPEERMTSFGDVASILHVVKDWSETPDVRGAADNPQLADLANILMDLLYRYMSGEADGKVVSSDDLLAKISEVEEVLTGLEDGSIGRESPRLDEFEKFIQGILTALKVKPSSTGETVIKL